MSESNPKDSEGHFDSTFDNFWLHSIYDKDLLNRHVDLTKITEHETLGFSSAGADGSLGERYRLDQSVLCEDHVSPPPPVTTEGSRRSSFVGLSDSDGGKQRSCLQRSDSFDSRSQPKRRQYSSRKPGRTNAADDEEQAFRNDDPAYHSQSSRSVKDLHSVAERKYRENLNAKIFHLEQTLLLAQFPDSKIQPLREYASLKRSPAKNPKAKVLTEAVRYVKYAESEKNSREQDIVFLRLQVTILGNLLILTVAVI